MLDKNPGVRPAGVGENWRRLFAKCVLRFTGPEANSACQDDQICVGLKSVIYGTFQGFQYTWNTKLTIKDRGFLLIYAKDAFNGINKIGML